MDQNLGEHEIGSDPIIQEVARQLAQHKLIPFFGAGASYAHLKVNWDDICAKMADAINLPPEARLNLLEIADRYVEIKGSDAFNNFIKTYLSVDTFDDDKGAAHLYLLSLGSGILYTTNQDDLFELCAKKYGRVYHSVINLDNLAQTTPGDYLLFKYHGDFADPGSIIFTGTSYDGRIKDGNHFLNIRLRSDLLAKGFFFVGYSFRDPNVRLLFEEIHKVFNGKTPPSYMIAYNYSSELEELTSDYNVKIINPRSYFPNAASNNEAFELCLKNICELVLRFKIESEMQSFFRPSIPPSTRMAISRDIDNVESIVNGNDFGVGIKVFRDAFDQTLIPEKHHDRVVNIFRTLVFKISNSSQYRDLQGALFNLKLSRKAAVDVLGLAMAASNFRQDANGYDFFQPASTQVPRALNPLASAIAVEELQQKQATITNHFLENAINWFEDYDDLPATLQPFVKKAMQAAWGAGRVPYDTLQARKKFRMLPKKDFHDFQSDLQALLPKRFGKPYE